MQQFCVTSSFFKLDNIKNATILRDFLIFGNWHHQKRSNSATLLHFFELDNIQNEPNSARRLQFLNMATSKTKQFCETSPSKMESWVQSATKNWCQVIRSAALVTQNHLSKPTDLMLQNATPLRKSAPWPPNISGEHVFCTAPATRHASLQILFKCPTPAIVLGNATKPSRFAHFWQGAQSLVPAMRNDILTSKSAPYPSVFCTFDFKMCFAPRRRALFWTSQLLKVVRCWCVLYILTSKCPSRHNSVQFFISHLASWLRTRRFSEPTFRPSWATNHWKNTVFRDFPTFSRDCIFFLLTLSLLLFSLLLFSSLWLCPSLLFMCPYCRKFDF